MQHPSYTPNISWNTESMASRYHIGYSQCVAVRQDEQAVWGQSERWNVKWRSIIFVVIQGLELLSQSIMANTDKLLKVIQCSGELFFLRDYLSVPSICNSFLQKKKKKVFMEVKDKKASRKFNSSWGVLCDVLFSSICLFLSGLLWSITEPKCSCSTG